MQSRAPVRIAIVGSPRDDLGAASRVADVFGDRAFRYVDARRLRLRFAAARHATALTPFDSRVSFTIHWSTPDEERLRVQLMTPLGELIELTRIPGVRIARGRRYRIFTVAQRGRGSSRWLRSLGELDGVFAEADIVSDVERVVRSTRVTPLPLGAHALPAPSYRAVRSVERALRRMEPGRFVLALPAPVLAGELEWFCAELLAQLPFAPLCIVLGDVPSGAGAATKRAIARGSLRILRGNLSADTIAAVAPCADAFVAPWASALDERVDVRRLMAMASSGVPLILAHGLSAGMIVEHESNGFVVETGCAGEWTSTVSGLFALPPLQRQFLGEEFSRRTFELHPVAAVREAYQARFDELLGRWAIPAELRAA